VEVPIERALVLWGGYPGHQPKEAVERFTPFLEDKGFDVVIEDSLAAYENAALMSSVSVILQNWTTGDITAAQFRGLSDAVPVVAGLTSFSIVSEQYYLAVDPAVEVLATTTFRRPAIELITCGPFPAEE
jgi:type 1 glutamine amidotransferase